MRGLTQNHLLARPALHEDGNLVTHGPGRQIDRTILAQKLSHPLAKALYSRIFTDLFVAYIRRNHRFQHPWRLGRFGVAAQIYECHVEVQSAIERARWHTVYQTVHIDAG